MNLRLISCGLMLLTSCVGSLDTPGPAVQTPGPPSISAEAVQKHAEQFEEDLPFRPPGSQEEFAAATYITGHLQQAGYVVRLESVPVADAVRSTNVVALPPSGDAETIVTVSYDTGRGKRDADGSEIGAFLELARALRAADEQHSVQFVALGAQSESALGAKRLARLLLDQEADPPILHIWDPTRSRGFLSVGEFADELISINGQGPGPISGPLIAEQTDPSDPFTPLVEAGFSVTYLSGKGVRVARTLLTWLQDHSR